MKRSLNARITWFALLGLPTFVLITLLGVQDIDFIGYGRETQVPLIGVFVPTVFFIAAPILTVAVYSLKVDLAGLSTSGNAKLIEPISSREMSGTEKACVWCVDEAVVQVL